jgi:hypothetical protein
LDIEIKKTTDKQADPSAFATLRGVGTVRDPDNLGHYQEGTNTGGLMWDPVDGNKNTGRKVFEIRNVYITPITRREE